MSIVRTKHNSENPFVMINRGSLWDENLSLEAAGLWARMLSRPDDWEICAKELAKSCKCSYRKILDILQELIEARYVIRKQENGKGKRGFSRVVYEVYEIKISFTHVDLTHALSTSDVKSTSTKERDNQGMKDKESSSKVPSEDSGCEPSATPDEEEEISKRINSRKDKTPIPNMRGYRKAVLKDIRSEAKDLSLMKSVISRRRAAVAPFHMKTIKGMYFCVNEENIEISKGQAYLVVRFDAPEDEWNKYLGFIYDN